MDENPGGRRALMPGVREFTVEPVTLAQPGPGQVLIETDVTLVSPGTELAVYTGIHQGLQDPRANWPRFPFGPGYSAAGRVIAAGPQVEGLAPGDRIAWPGSHRSHALVDTRAQSWRKIPESLACPRAAFVYLLRYPVVALAQTRQWVGLPVVVQGLGLIGQLALRLYGLLGAWPVIGIDPVASRREAARRGGAAAVIDPSTGEVPEQLRAELGGRLAPVCVDATGVAQAVVSAAELLAYGGQLVVLGSPRGVASEVDMYELVHRRSLTITGAHGSLIEGRQAGHSAWTEDRALGLITHLLAAKRLAVMDLVTHEIGVEELGQAYESMFEDKEQYLGVLIRWD